jgi:hypothetical protein
LLPTTSIPPPAPTTPRSRLALHRISKSAPWLGGNSLRPSNDIASPFAQQTIDRITAERIGKHFVPTASPHPSLRLARDRILQAVSERSDHIDSFIDFVIAWESIGGYSESTTVLVSGAMSILLSPDDLEKRRDLLSKIKKLYGRRREVTPPSISTPLLRAPTVRYSTLNGGAATPQSTSLPWMISSRDEIRTRR